MAKKRRRINADCLEKVKQWEGLRLEAYKDVSGVLTIGYGHTNGSGGVTITPNMKITEAEAETYLLSDLAQYERCVEDSVKVPLSDNQFGALVSFCYNVGVNSFKRSTLLKKLNRGDYNAVPSELQRWNRTSKGTCNGLTNRRAAEGGLWASDMLPSPNYVVAGTQGTFNTHSTSIVSGVLGSLSGIGSFFSEGSCMQYVLGAFVVVALLVIVWNVAKQSNGK